MEELYTLYGIGFNKKKKEGGGEISDSGMLEMLE